MQRLRKKLVKNGAFTELCAYNSKIVVDWELVTDLEEACRYMLSLVSPNRLK
jgi:hypothetical protein